MKIGITGGIGSGKSAVCRLFAGLGVPVYDCDLRGRELLSGDGKVKAAIVELLGPEAYSASGPNREFIARKVFGDRALLTSINAIIHPAVAGNLEAWVLTNASLAPYVVAESAVLFESGFDKFFDTTINVAAPENVRLERIIARGGIDRESALERMKNQFTDNKRCLLADRTIDNTGTLNDLKLKVIQLDKEFRKLIR